MPPILTSLLDTDAYKLHMQQAVFHRYPDAEVVAEFHSRNEEDLLPMMGQIEEQLRRAGLRVIVHLDACRGIAPETVASAHTQMIEAGAELAQTLTDVQRLLDA